ncbi:MAG: hypothetical protein GY851_09270 [bacterium]|nr:hypothetical protein [bacterium]
MTNDERILGKLDAIDTKVDDTRETMVAISTRMEFVATRDDLSTAIQTHVNNRHATKPINWKPIVVGIGAVLAAVAASIGGVALQ